MLSQEAIAIAFEAELRRLSTPECYFNSISVELTAKRDYMVRFLKEAGMNPIVPEGGYFLLADWSSLGKSYKPFAYQTMLYQGLPIILTNSLYMTFHSSQGGFGF